MAPEQHVGEWSEYQRLVLSELHRLNDNIEAVEVRMQTNLETILRRQAAQDVEIAQLKMKAGTWGVIGGAVPIAVTVMIWLVTEIIGGIAK